MYRKFMFNKDQMVNHVSFVSILSALHSPENSRKFEGG